jgi:phenylacetate-CoA ligase
VSGGELVQWEQFRERLHAEVVAGLPEHVERLSWSADRIRQTQEQSLRRLLVHAVEHSPYHRRRLAGIDVENFGLEQLPRLPVMTKAGMMAAFDEVLTDRHLSRATIEQALVATDSAPVPVRGSAVAFVTGGAAGPRGVLAFDVRARAGFILSLLRPVIARLRLAGGPRPGGLSIAMVGAASAVHASGSVAAAAEHASVPVQVHQVPVTLPLAEIVRRLNELQPPVLVGYPSMLARLAAERRAGALEIAPLAITATGETLHAEVRAAVSRAFGAPVVNTFASTEGLVGVSPPGDSTLVFNDDMCIVELVDADNQPVAPGVASAKVLLTNLYNPLQPLIRYELSDIFIRQPDASEHGHLRAVVRGRGDEVLRYHDLAVHPHVVRSILLRARDILDYQVRQAPRGIDLDVIAGSDADLASVTDELVQALEQTGLERPSVRVTPVARLPLHPHTGKLSRFVPLPG